MLKNINVFKEIIHRPILFCWLSVRSPGKQDGSSRAELLSCLEDYKNGYCFFCVIPIKKVEQIYVTSQLNKTGAMNKSLLLVLDVKFRASEKHLEFKVAIM